MRGGEDLSSRRRRSSSRSGTWTSLVIEASAFEVSNGSEPGPIVKGVSTAGAEAAAGRLRHGVNGPAVDRAVLNAEPQAGTSVVSVPHSSRISVEGEADHSSHADGDDHDPPAHGCGLQHGQGSVAWQPGIETLLEGMQQPDLQQGNSTETRRLSDSAASGPRSYPLSPRTLAAVSPGPPLPQRDDSIAAAHPTDAGHPPAGPASIGLPAPAHLPASAANAAVPPRLNGWALAPHAARASATDTAELASDRDGTSSAAGPPCKQPSHIETATPAALAGDPTAAALQGMSTQMSCQQRLLHVARTLTDCAFPYAASSVAACPRLDHEDTAEHLLKRLTAALAGSAQHHEAASALHDIAASACEEPDIWTAHAQQVLSAKCRSPSAAHCTAADLLCMQPVTC